MSKERLSFRHLPKGVDELKVKKFFESMARVAVAEAIEKERPRGWTALHTSHHECK